MKDSETIDVKTALHILAHAVADELNDVTIKKKRDSHSVSKQTFERVFGFLYSLGFQLKLNVDEMKNKPHSPLPINVRNELEMEASTRNHFLSIIGMTEEEFQHASEDIESMENGSLPRKSARQFLNERRERKESGADE